MRADSNSVLDGSGLQLLQARAHNEVEFRVLRFSDEQAPSLQQPGDAPIQGVKEFCEFFICRAP
jgi:hypothetical protein